MIHVTINQFLYNLGFLLIVFQTIIPKNTFRLNGLLLCYISERRIVSFKNVVYFHVLFRYVHNVPCSVRYVHNVLGTLLCFENSI